MVSLSVTAAMSSVILPSGWRIALTLVMAPLDIGLHVFWGTTPNPPTTSLMGAVRSWNSAGDVTGDAGDKILWLHLMLSLAYFWSAYWLRGRGTRRHVSGSVHS